MKIPDRCPTCGLVFYATEDAATGSYKPERHEAEPGASGICTTCFGWWELQEDGSAVAVEPTFEDWQRLALWARGARSN